MSPFPTPLHLGRCGSSASGGCPRRAPSAAPLLSPVRPLLLRPLCLLHKPFLGPEEVLRPLMTSPLRYYKPGVLPRPPFLGWVTLPPFHQGRSLGGNCHRFSSSPVVSGPLAPLCLLLPSASVCFPHLRLAFGPVSPTSLPVFHVSCAG